eukprot:scaffold85912_cov42-Attheya_sp.AAC.3
MLRLSSLVVAFKSFCSDASSSILSSSLFVAARLAWAALRMALRASIMPPAAAPPTTMVPIHPYIHCWEGRVCVFVGALLGANN